MCPVFTETADVTDQEDEGSAVSTQWEDPSLCDHGYDEQQGVEQNAKDATTQTEDFSHSTLQSDSDSFLCTGVSLETFNSLVSALEVFAERAFVTVFRLRCSSVHPSPVFPVVTASSACNGHIEIILSQSDLYPFAFVSDDETPI